MWKLFFDTCDFLCNLIPSRARRADVRKMRLYDCRKKYRALRDAFPDLRFSHVKMIKGGWNIGFIVDRKYVFKIRKFYDREIPTEKIMREKRITDAFVDISPLRIPKIDIIESHGYTFYKYDFIPGKNLNRCSLKTIRKNAARWARQLAGFINAVHNARPDGIDDLKDRPGDGWNHNDICNNIIIDTKTGDIVGLIDWEYSGWGMLATEFENCTAFSHKMRDSGIADAIKNEYAALQKKK